MQTNTTFSKIVKKPKQGNAPAKVKANKPKHINKRVWGE